MFGGQDALTAEEEKVVAAEPEAAAVPTVHNDALLGVNEDDHRNLENAVGLDKVEHFEVKRKLRRLQERYHVKRKKVPTSVVETFTLARDLLRSVDVDMSMTV